MDPCDILSNAGGVIEIRVMFCQTREGSYRSV